MRKLIGSFMALAFVVPVGARAAAVDCAGPVASFRSDTRISLYNNCLFRVWDAGSLKTVSITDARTHETLSTYHPDFTFQLDGANVSSDRLLINSVDSAIDPSGAHGALTWHLLLPGALEITRTVEMFAGIAGFRTQTTINSLAPLALSGYTLDEVGVGAAQATIQAFRAGSDWRSPDWNPPSIGDPHTGDVRVEQKGAPGQAITGNGEWISAALPSGEHVAMVAQRRDYASSVASYDGSTQSIGVDFSRDVIYSGPIEESGHVENPGPGPARHRIVEPTRPLELESAFTLFGTDADDEAWQYFKYLSRSNGYRKAVIFNSDGVDSNAHSTGAKDDMTFDRFKAILPSVKQMGFDTFVFDDGWFARSGDWCPDSPQCPEPRNASDPVKFAPRFPDDHFGAVKDLLDQDGIALGLWMSPLSYHPRSKAYQTNPQWACAPVGHATGALSLADDGSSEEPGIGLWNPLAWGVDPDTGAPERMIDYLEGRVRRAIESYGATFFKFDFIVWTDCGGVEPVTMYETHDAFVQMLDRVRAAHPEVTFEIDDTNDYRMFPFETIERGPSWYQNGGPTFAEQMHNVWKLAPFVPGYALGQRALARRNLGIDTMMSTAIQYHLTFSQPVDTNFTNSERDQVGKWTAFYKANRDTLATFSYPLLDDPNADSWTALQPWNGDAHSGWLLAYRQNSAEGTHVIALRGLGGAPADQMFHLTQIDPATGLTTYLGAHPADELRTLGAPVEIARPNGYAIIRITPA